MPKTKKRKTSNPISTHNSQKFPVWVIFLRQFSLWSLLLVLVGFNIFYVLNTSGDRLPVFNVLLQPGSPETHINFADYLWQNKQYDAAKRELAVAENLQQNPNGMRQTVLGESTDKILSRWNMEQATIQQNYDYWKNILKENPDYRDAFVMLASLAFHLDRPTEAREYIQKARSLDPNVVIDKRLTEELNLD